MAHKDGGELGEGYGGTGHKGMTGHNEGGEGGKMEYGEERLTAEKADYLAHMAAGKEGYDDPNSEDPTSKGVGGEPLGNRK